MSRSRIVVALLPLVVLSAACGGEDSAPAPLALTEPTVETVADGVPLPLLPASLPVVEATLPGGLSARLLVDTGADLSLIDADFAQRGKLDVRPLATTVSGRSIGARFETSSAVRFRTLHLGDAVVRDLVAPVADLSQICEGAIDGILGQDVLSQWAILFDAPASELRILRREDLAGGLGKLYVHGSRFQGMKMKAAGATNTIGFVGGSSASFRMKIDTGASGTFLPRSAISALELEKTGETGVRRVGGVTEGRDVYLVKRLGLGDVSFTNFEIVESEREVGLLGWHPLKQIVFVIDGPTHQLLFAHEAKRRP